MFYKPNFCCSCGEKIDRTDWTLFTSRRFCPLCESENLGHDYFVRGLTAVGVLIGLFGVAAMFGGGRQVSEANTSTTIRVASAARMPALAVENRQAAAAPLKPAVNPEGVDAPAATVSSPGAATLTSANGKSTSREPVYYCQAITKKGTRCTRRIKSPGFCWQHSRSLINNGGLQDR